MRALLLFGWTLWQRLRAVLRAGDSVGASKRPAKIRPSAEESFYADICDGGKPARAPAIIKGNGIADFLTGFFGSHLPALSNRTTLAHSRIGQTLIIALLSLQPLWATMPNQMVWEVRPGAGSDTNSGAFATLTNNTTLCTGGTDWTQQNAAQVTFNGSTVTATTAGAGATITITGYSVLATDVCNTLRISAGTNFVTGLFQIVSVSTGSNTWTLDRNVTTGAGSGMTGTMGGALATLKQSFADVVANVAQGNCTVWYKAGTDTVTSTVTQPITNGLLIHGYQTTRGDNTGTRPLLTTATNGVNLVSATASSGNSTWTWNNVSFSNTAVGASGIGFYAPTNAPARALMLINCVLSGFTYGILGDFNGDYVWAALTIYQTEIKNSVNDGIKNQGMAWIVGSYLHNNGATGATTLGNGSPLPISLTVEDSVIASNGTDGLCSCSAIAGSSLIVKNTVLYANTHAGILISSSDTFPNVTMVNNIFDGNLTYGIRNLDAAADYYQTGAVNRFNNAFYNNSTAATVGLPADASDITLSADPFVSAGSNYALNSTAGGGAALKAAGFPGILPAGVGTGYLDVGALQSQCSASGGGGGACGFVQ